MTEWLAAIRRAWRKAVGWQDAVWVAIIAGAFFGGEWVQFAAFVALVAMASHVVTRVHTPIRELTDAERDAILDQCKKWYARKMEKEGK